MRTSAWWTKSTPNPKSPGPTKCYFPCLEGLALIASTQGHPERAARLFGAAEAARDVFGITMPREGAGDQEHFWATIRERPEGTAFATAWAEGRAMTLEQAIEYALQGDGASA